VTAPPPGQWARLTSRLPPLDAVVGIDAEVLAERLASLPDEANALLRLLDGRRTLREVIAGSGQDEIEAAGVMARLHELGVLRFGASSAGRSAERPGASTPAPTPAQTPAPDGVEWFAAPEGAREVEPEPHDPADIPDDAPQPGGGWVREILARLRR
jgi:hypothetical protein